MGAFTNKIDFEVVIMVNHGNPNGDPLNGNRPREDLDRKIRRDFGCMSEKKNQKSSAGYGRENFYTKRRTL